MPALPLLPISTLNERASLFAQKTNIVNLLFTYSAPSYWRLVERGSVEFMPWRWDSRIS